MKPWSLLASLLLAASLHAGAASSQDTANVGQLADNIQRGMAQRCAESNARAAAPASAAGGYAVQDPLDHDLSCTCGPQAVAIAFPAAMRADAITFGAFMARMSGAMNGCVARSVRHLIDPPCAQGIDPFGDDRSSASSSAKAHCDCARSALDKAATADALKDADDASARYAASQSEVERTAVPLRMLNEIEKACAPEVVK